MIRLAKELGKVKVVCDQRMSPTCTKDAAQAALNILKNNLAYGIYHVVNSGSASWYEFAKEIISLTGISAEVLPVFSSEYGAPAMRPPYSVLDNTKLVCNIGEIRLWDEALAEYLIEKGYAKAAKKEVVT
jgi:dTDP-4-dehydrorhamnose reductase